MSDKSYVTGSFSKDLKKFKRNFYRELTFFSRNVSDEMVKEIKKRTPVYSGPHRPGGRLRESIRPIRTVRTPTGVRGGAQSSLKRASFTEYDTAPHKIRARRAPNLIFWWARESVLFVGKYVNHPGTTGAHMFAKGSDAVEADLHIKMERLIARVKRISGL